MLKSFRKLVFPLAFVFLIETIVPISAFGAEAPAQTQTGKVASPVKTEISLEQAIALVKENFEVPKEFNKFTSGYSSYNNRESWSLNWSKADQPGGSFSAQVDVSSGEILSMNLWKNDGQPEQKFNLPKLSYEEAREIAQKLVNKMLPSRLGELQWVKDDSQVMPLNYYGPVSYSFQWKRVVNGTPFPSNFVTVQVNGQDGQVTGYNGNWSSDNFPSLDGVIGEAKAQQTFSSQKMLELQYFTAPMIQPLTTATQAKARLVYQLSKPSINGAIDAITGEPVKLESGQWLVGDDLALSRGGDGGEAKGSIQQPVLTPEEQSEVEKNNQVITREQAVEAARKWINIPDSLSLRNASLGMDGGYVPKRVWTLDWNLSPESKGVAQYIYARVDAESGELLAFNFSPNAGNDSVKDTPIDRSSAQKIVEEFLQKIQPQRFGEVELVDEVNGTYKGSNEGQVQGFNYQRVVNGIPFPNNGITVMLDAVSKTVISYNLNWWTLDFQNPSESMAQENAEATFLKGRQLELEYIQIMNNNGLSKIRLVYKPSMNNALARSNVMDAKTGQFLDWQGQPLADLLRPYYFKDISGNFAEKEISLLGQAGIFGEDGDQFKPNDTLFVQSILKAMLAAKNGAAQTMNIKDEDILQKAKDLGWWKEELAPTSPVDRELMAKLLIRMTDLENISQLQELYKSPYKDINEDSPSLGYVALVKGLGLMKIDGTEFEPRRIITRAEGAYALVNSLKVKR
ncbi:YcdB/YcdC domain-containing protein [Desulfitobacterium sp. AusDCA]|uniref:YcdB/YcdC domain-containing protein n=1 Tax=Desulfitobacterium sp. AusDCA TaxID=3240383 RepID=UPI003DA720E7